VGWGAAAVTLGALVAGAGMIRDAAAPNGPDG